MNRRNEHNSEIFPIAKKRKRLVVSRDYVKASECLKIVNKSNGRDYWKNREERRNQLQRVNSEEKTMKHEENKREKREDSRRQGSRHAASSSSYAATARGVQRRTCLRQGESFDAERRNKRHAMQPSQSSGKGEREGHGRMLRRMKTEIDDEYQRLLSLCEKKLQREDTRSRKMMVKQQRIQMMREYLGEESASESDNEDDMQRFIELNEKILDTEQRLMKDRHRILHDELCVNAVDDRNDVQTVYLECDIKMMNTGNLTGKRVITAPFQETYTFDGTKVSRKLYEIDTRNETINELTWCFQESENRSVTS